MCLLRFSRCRMEFAVALLDPSRADMALHRDADMVRTIGWARHVKLLSGLAGSQGDRPRPRVALEAFASAAEADLLLLAGGVLLTRVSTRSAVSRSVN